jgi:hypothetical protein
VSQPKRVADLLPRLLTELKASARVAPLAEALRAVLPEAQAARCRVAGFRAGRLWVEVDSAPLLAELRSFARDELRARINAFLADQTAGSAGRGTVVSEIVFRVGGTAHV